MSMTIFWKPKSGGSHLNVGSSSKFIEIMEKAFGYKGPWVLDNGDLEKLEGIDAAFDTTGLDESPWQTLIDAINEDDAIEVWAGS